VQAVGLRKWSRVSNGGGGPWRGSGDGGGRGKGKDLNGMVGDSKQEELRVVGGRR